MGQRAERRSERRFLFLHARRIRSLCTRCVDKALPRGDCPVCGRAYVQAHARDRSHCPSAFGLLAAPSFSANRLHSWKGENPAVREAKTHNTTVFPGKDSLAHPFRRRRYRYICTAKTRCWPDPSAPVSLARRECGHVLRHLRVENALAHAPRGFLSASK